MAARSGYVSGGDIDDSEIGNSEANDSEVNRERDEFVNDSKHGTRLTDDILS